MRKIFIMCLIVTMLLLCAPVMAGTYYFEHSKSGYMNRNNATGTTWADLHDGTSATNDGQGIASSTYFWAGIYGDDTVGLYRTFYRSGVTFDTSSIPNDEYITNATLSWYVTTKTEGANYDSAYVICPWSPANPMSYVYSDYSYLKFGPSLCAVMSTSITAGAYNNWTLAQPNDYINKLGYTTFGLLDSWDYSNTPLSMPTVENQRVTTNCAPTCSNQIRLYIITGDAPIAPISNFTATPTSGNLPLTVQFNDTSTNTPTYWSWDFGDGYYYSGTSAFAQNPTHIYNSIGLYNVSLFVQNTDGGDSETKVGYINASAGIPASYNFRCLIYDTSYNAIDGATFNIAYYNNTTIQTDTTHNGGYVYFTVPNYQMIYGNVSKAGYEITNFIINFGTIYDSWQMLYHSWETPEIPAYYGNLMLSVLDSTDMSGIDFAKIEVYTNSNMTTKIDTQYTDNGFWAMFEPLNQDLYYVVSHPSYNTRDFTYNITWSPAYYSILLTKTGLPPETGGYNISITCIDASTNSYVNGAWFTASKTSNVYENYAVKTNSSGIAVIQHVPPGLYYLTSLYSGYYTNNQTVSITSSDISRTVYISPYTGTPIPTFTPVQTPVWTGPGGVPGNAIEGLYNFVMFLGIGQLAAGVLIGLCITCGCAIALAIFAGGTGAMLGACVGFIGCCVIGFFPIWLLFIAVILIFAVFFIFRSGSEE